MNRTALANPNLIKAVLVLQFIPILLYPPATFNPASQEWWLPAILVLMALIGSVQILRKSPESWPQYLVAFAQGFNIISRLMMFMPQLAAAGGNPLYLVFTVISMIISAFILWYIELPEVKQRLAH